MSMSATTSGRRLVLKTLLACFLLSWVVAGVALVDGAPVERICPVPVGIVGVRAGEKDQGSHAVAKRAIRDGDYQKAVKVFLAILTADPTDVRAHIGAAYGYYKLQDYKLSFEQVTAALKLDENNARAHALGGIALLRSGYLDNAVAELMQAIRLNPKEALAWGGLAEIDYYTNHTKESRQKSLYALELDSRGPYYLVTFARDASRLELFYEAADAYERFLRFATRT